VGAEGGHVHGGHFLQWSSSYQDRDWYNMPLDDCTIVMTRLARLEEALLGDNAGYVSIIKNCGRLVGGSIAHGHQQVGFSTVLPRRNRDLVRFEKKNGKRFSTHMLEHTPDELLLKDYGTAVLVIPYFMRRPFDMMLIVKDTEKQHLHALSEQELRDVANGWHDGIRAMRAALTGLDKQIAYNITANTGPGTGIFFDFLPYTQEMGGFEHLGLFVCQSTPQISAEYLHGIIE
jgi:diadenosine tetraphosphate (Ap4A) HIT family hydrolase